jgi:hypothetical protein
MQMQPITKMPAAKMAPPSITRNSASAISGSAKTMREPISEPPARRAGPFDPVGAPEATRAAVRGGDML